jgi:hypothetical protein
MLKEIKEDVTTAQQLLNEFERIKLWD